MQHGCIALEWATDAAGQPWYDVVKFENLRARVYIVPDFRRNDRLGLVSGSTLVDPNDAPKAYFHLGAFKWDRSVPDKSGFPAAAAGAADAADA